MRWAVLLVTATGCQQLFGLDEPRVTDAGGDSAIDGTGDTQLTCIERWKGGKALFDPPVAVAGVNGAATSERYPYVVELPGLDEIYFSRDSDFHSATGENDTFMMVQAETALSSNMNDTKIAVNENLTRAWFASNRSGGAGAFDLYRGHRADPQDTWQVDQMYLGTLNDATSQADPHMSNDTLRLYYAPGDTAMGQRIGGAYRASINQAFGNPIISMALDSGAAGEEMDPTLTDDELVIVFTSTRTGNKELYFATRNTMLADFSPPQPIDDLNDSATDEQHPHISKDGCRLYFVSNRNGSDDILMARMR